MRCGRAAVLLVVIGSLAAWGQSESLQPGKNQLTVRGETQDVYFYPGSGTGPHRKVLFTPGDGGWHGFAVTIAQKLSGDGYDVYGLDTRVYLRSFTGGTVLKTAEIASDFGELGNWVRQGGKDRVLLMGWSEGAGLGVVATADPANRGVFQGLVAIGTPDASLLAWHWKDIAAEIAKSMPNEPTFSSAAFIANVSPLPLFMIASVHDEYVPPQTSKTLFAAAREPKQLVMIDGSNHKYGGKTDEFFRTVREGLQWIAQH